MKTYKIPHTDLVVSRLAYGAAMLGRDQRSADFMAQTVKAIRTAYDNGITFFDLADVYGSGQSEAALREALPQLAARRDKIVIQSKCGVRFAPGFVIGDPVHADTARVDLSREHIVRAVEGSLKRLDTDYLDVLLLHAPDVLARPEESAQAFDELERGGKVRYFGVSNYNVFQIELLKKHVRQPLVANQIWLGLACYAPLAVRQYAGAGGIVDYCQLHDIQVQAYSPLRGRDDPLNRVSLLTTPADASPQLKQVAQMLADLAQRKGTNPSAIALAWLLSHRAGIVPIIGATNPQHVIENCAADGVVLSSEEWYTLFNAADGIQSQKTAP